MEDIKKKRGRPKKGDGLIVLPDAVLEIIKEALAFEENKEHEEFKQLVEEKKTSKKDWDISLNDQIKYFDPTLSYELTGYKPINGERGLDFNPSWFTEVRETKQRTGHYTQYHPRTKSYNEFWRREYDRCRNGLTINGYTITGDHYFFLNYYLLADVTSTSGAGEGRSLTFPAFSVAQYEYLHYIALVKKLRKHACLMKARGLGFSEMNAALVLNMYSTRKLSRSIVAAKEEGKLTPTLRKIWSLMNFLDELTDGGFRKLRQKKNSDMTKRASRVERENGSEIEKGYMSLIDGVVADKPDKIRGERVDMLIYEEGGSWEGLRTAFIQGEALVAILGNRFGFKLVGGTGGDTNPKALADLKDIYLNPDVYDVLPFKHNFTPSGDSTLSGYFLPAYCLVLAPGFMDDRGWCDPVKAKEYHDSIRATKAASPKAYLDYCAEFCYTAEEAFSKEGSNKFDKVILAEQLAQIRVLKAGPKIQTGTLKAIFKRGGEKHKCSNIISYDWKLDINNGKIHILEHPIWTDLYKLQLEELRVAYEKQGIVWKPEEYSDIRSNLYLAGIDSIDLGQEETSENTDDPSKFAIIIYKRRIGVQDPIPVAYYKDRPDHIRDAYQIAMALVSYYNAITNIEASKINLLSWAKDNGYYKYFMMRPRKTYPDPNKIGKRTPGTPATPSIIDHQLKLIEAYIEDYGYNIWFLELLEELTSYSYETKTKFDLVAAFGMVMLADEELGDTTIVRITKQEESNNFNLGYYYDENNIKHYGVIPTLNTQTRSIEHHPEVRSSDPRKW